VDHVRKRHGFVLETSCDEPSYPFSYTLSENVSFFNANEGAAMKRNRTRLMLVLCLLPALFAALPCAAQDEEVVRYDDPDGRFYFNPPPKWQLLKGGAKAAAAAEVVQSGKPEGDAFKTGQASLVGAASNTLKNDPAKLVVQFNDLLGKTATSFAGLWVSPEGEPASCLAISDNPAKIRCTQDFVDSFGRALERVLKEQGGLSASVKLADVVELGGVNCGKFITEIEYGRQPTTLLVVLMPTREGYFTLTYAANSYDYLVQQEKFEESMGSFRVSKPPRSMAPFILLGLAVTVVAGINIGMRVYRKYHPEDAEEA